MSWAYFYRSNVVGEIIKHSYRRGMLRASHYMLTSAVNPGIDSISQPFPGRLHAHTPIFSHNIHTSSCYCSDESNENQQRKIEDYNDDGDNGVNVNQGQEKKEGVIERLRRLSMSSPEEYELSPMAKMKAVEMAQTRKETKRKGEEWKWDQQNLREWVPQGAPRRQNHYEQPRHRSRYDPDGDEEEYDFRMNESRNQNQRDFGNYNNYSGGNRNSYNNDFGNYNSTRGNWREQPQQSSRHEIVHDHDSNEPEDYELEMQKLRDRIQQNKASRTAAEDRVANLRRSTQPSDKSSDLPASHDSHPENASQYEESFGNVNNTRHPDHRMSEDDVSFEQIAQNPDSFGNLLIGSRLVKDDIGIAIRKELSEEAKALSISSEEEDDDSKLTPPRRERWTSDKLIRKVRDLLKEKKLKEAVDTYLGALTEGGFHFDNKGLRHHFLVLINECANVGYVDMAFRLYNLMKKRGYREKNNTFSSLLNACANSPWDKEKNLDKIERLLITVKERGFELNEINYLALIKAYGRLGEIVLAFDVVDKMINDPQMRIGANAFNLLLQACISDPKNGFRHTLVTWRKMHSMKIKPDIYSFNLLLRAVRDCGIDASFAVNHNVPSLPRPEEQIWLPPIVSEEDSNLVLQTLCSENQSETPEHLMLSGDGESKSIDTNSLIKLLKRPENRFAVLGGLKGFLVEMVRCKVGPNLKTFTQLLEVIQPDHIADVLHLLKLYKIKPDITFYAVAISRSSAFRNDALVKELVRQMSLHNLVPNIVVWGALAKGCNTWQEAKNLLNEMNQAQFNPNIDVMVSLLTAAVVNADPKYVLHVMEETRKREIPLAKDFLSILERFYQTTQRRLVDKELGKPIPAKFEEAMERNLDFSNNFVLFKMRYPTWLKTVVVKVEPENPWKEDFENFKKYKKHTPPESDTIEDSDDEQDTFINK